MSASILKIRLFGAFEITLNDQPLPLLRAKKAQWLLALLALRQGKEVRRDVLAQKLWPDSIEYLRNLRQCLSDSHQLGLTSNTLHSSPHTLMLDTVDVWVDVIAFNAAIKTGTPLALERAVALYRGPLLEHCEEEWIFPERSVIAEAYLGALKSLAEHARLANDLPTEIRLLRSLLATDPHNECACRNLMLALSDAGDQPQAITVYKQFCQLLHDKLAMEPDPEIVDLYDSLSSGTRVAVLPPVLSETPGPPCCLPVPITDLVGRFQEIVEVADILEARRLVTLTGTGGVGKTRLSIAVARKCLTDHEAKYRDGVWFVDFAALAESRLVPQMLARAIDIQAEKDVSIEETLMHSLKRRSLLLILDNCEHLVQACASIAARLLHACPDVQILATSRHALDIPGEMIYEVPSLRSPDPQELSLSDKGLLSELADYDAVRLFVLRAQEQQKDFVLNSSNALAVAEVCSWLGGIPLALELAAARIKVLTVAEIANRLHDCFRLLTRGSHAVLPRHQTLQATIDWSYSLLNDAEKTFLQRLSVFTAGWTLEAAERVCDVAGVEEWEVLDLLTSLANKSLVVCDKRQGETRYNLLRTLRHYAAEKLFESGKSNTIRKRHCDYFLSLAEAAVPNLTNVEQAEWLQRLEEEHENLRSALAWSLTDENEGVSCLRLCGAIWRFWTTRGYLKEGQDWCERTLDRWRGQSQTPEQATALNGAGMLAYFLSDFAAAKNHLEKSRQIREGLGNRKDIAESVNNLAMVARIQGENALARTYAEESLAISREINDKQGIADAFTNLGNSSFAENDFAAARQYDEQCLAIRRDLGDRCGTATSLNNLGAVLETLGERARAQTCYKESCAIYEEIGDKQGIALALNNLGIAAENQGDYERAEIHLRASLTIYQEVGNRHRIARLLNNLGSLAYSQGKYADAWKFDKDCLAIRRELGDWQSTAKPLHNLGNVFYALEDYTSARAYYEESLLICRKIGTRMGIAESLEAFALLITSETAPTPSETNEISEDAGAHIAARLWGAALSLRKQIDAPLPPKDQLEQTQQIAIVRKRLNEAEWSAAWEEGLLLTMDEAVIFAMYSKFVDLWPFPFFIVTKEDVRTYALDNDLTDL